MTYAGPILGPIPFSDEATVYVHQIVVDTKSVPEPSVMGLLAALLGGTVFIRRRAA